MPRAPYFRQVSFDDAWEKSNEKDGQGHIRIPATSFNLESVCSTIQKRSQHKRKFVNVKNEGRQRTKQRRMKLKLIPGRRKSVATRSKAT